MIRIITSQNSDGIRSTKMNRPPLLTQSFLFGLVFLFFMSPQFGWSQCINFTGCPAPGAPPLLITLDGEGRATLLIEDISIQANHTGCGIASETLSQSQFNCNDVPLGQISVDYIVVDGNGDMAICAFTVEVSDNTAPNVESGTEPTSPESYLCEDRDNTWTLVSGREVPPVSLSGEPTFEDACGLLGTPTFVDAITSNSGPNCYTITRTWTATDVNSNSSQYTQIINVTDDTDPAFTNINNSSFGINNRTISCNGPGNNTANNPVPAPPVNPSYNDNCSASGDIVLTTDSRDSRFINYDNASPIMMNPSITPATSAYYNYEITHAWVITDECGNVSSFTQTITVQDITSPSFTGLPANTTVSTNTVTGCAATFPTGGLDLELDNTNVSDGCGADFANITGSYTSMNTTTNTAGPAGNGFNANTDNNGDDNEFGVGDWVITFTATDPSGRTNTAQITFTVADFTGPVAECTSFTASVDANGNGLVNASSFDNGSSDNCGNVSFRFRVPSVAAYDDFESQHIFGCSDIGMTYTVEFEVSDGANINTCMTTIEIIDDSGPIVIPNDVTVMLTSADPNPSVTVSDFLGNNSYDLCGGIDFGSSTVSPDNFDCDDLGANGVQVTLTVFDMQGNSTVANATVFVQDKIDPIISCQGYSAPLSANGNVTVPRSLLLNGDYEFYLQGGDANGTTEICVTPATGGTLSFSWEYESNDASANFDEAGYRLGNGSLVEFTTSASTSQGGSDAISVSNGQQVCFSIESAGGTSERGYLRIYDISADLTGDIMPHLWEENSDNNGSAFIAGNDLLDTDLATSLGTSGIDDCTGIFNFSIGGDLTYDCGDVGSNTETLAVTDGEGNNATCNATVTITDSSTPMIMCDDFTAQLDENGDVTVEAGWFIMGDRILVMESGLPANAAPNGGFSSTSGETVYSVTAKSNTSVSFDYSYIQVNGNRPSLNRFGYIINGTFTPLVGGSTPTTGTGSGQATGSSGNISLSPQDEFSIVMYTDQYRNNSGTAFNYNAKVEIANFTFENDFDPVNWTKSNSDVASSSYIFNLTENMDGIAITGSSISDNCDGAVTNYADYEITFNGATSLARSCTSPTPETVTIEVTDKNGQSETCTAEMTIVDNSAPVIGFCPPDGTNIFIPASGVYDVTALFTINATDNCGTATKSTTPQTIDCSQVGNQVTITTTFTDAAGNTASCETIVNVRDNIAPNMNVPVDVTIACEDEDNITPADLNGLPTINDNCAFTQSASNPSYNDVPMGSGIGYCRSIERTWTATDDAGNMVTDVQMIYITDTEAPKFYNNNNVEVTGTTTQTALCDPDGALDLTVNDNCDDNVSFSTVTTDSRFIGNTNQFDSDESGYYNYTLTRVYTSTDNCGNTATVTQMITVEDDVAPNLADVPASLSFSSATGDCYADITAAILETDLDLETNIDEECAGFDDLTISFSVSPANGVLNFDPTTGSGEYDVDTYTLTITVDDPSNVTGSVTKNITIEVTDEQAPEVGTQDITIQLSNGTATLDPEDIEVSSDDNCAIATRAIDITTLDCTNLGENIVTLTVTDVNGNSATETAIVTITSNEQGSFTANASSTDETFAGANDGTATVTVTGSGTYEYLWTNGDGSQTYTTQSISGLAPDTYTIEVTDVDPNGSGCVFTTSVVVAPGSPADIVCFEADDVNGVSGSTVNIPVYAENFEDVSSFQFILELPDVANFTLTGGAINLNSTLQANISGLLTATTADPATNTINLSFLSNGGPITINGGNRVRLFDIQVTLDGTIGASDEVELSSILATQDLGNGEIAVNPAPFCNDNGVVSIQLVVTHEVSGTVYMPDQSTPVGDVSVEINGGSSQLTQDGVGEYSFNAVDGTTNVISLEKNINWANGVFSNDLLAAIRHYLGQAPITDLYSLAALDMAQDNTFNILDLREIQITIGAPATYTGSYPSWNFVPTSEDLNNWVTSTNFGDVVVNYPQTRTYSNINAPVANADFIAIKMGNIVGTASADQLNQGDTRSSLILNTDNKAVNKDEAVIIPFTSDNFDNTNAYQFTFDFDTDAFEYVGVTTNEKLTSFSESNFYTHSIEEGKLTCVWAYPIETLISNEDVLFSIELKAKEDVAQLSDVIAINSSITPTMAVDADLQTRGLELFFNEVETSVDPVTEFTLYQNNPNPFNEFTSIKFDLPEANTVTLTATDISGKTLFVQKNDFSAGVNFFEINNEDLPGGILIYQVSTPSHTATKKMISIK